MKLYEIKTYNSIWFGGLKHMTSGEEHYAKSGFLPNIMRLFHIVKSNNEGKCYGVLIKKRDKLFFPLPADIVGKRKTGGEWKLLKLIKSKLWFEDLELIPLITGTFEAYESAEGYMISHKGIKLWMSAFKENLDKTEQRLNEEIVSIDDLIKRELKVGLQINKDTGTAEEGMLYFQERIRIEDDTSYVFIADKINKKIPFFGGERNPAVIKELDSIELKELDEKIQILKNNYYRFYILSHTFFENKELKIGNITFELIWIYSRGSEFISGYRKPAIEMLKPGSVLVLRAKENGIIKRLCQIEYKPPIDKYGLDKFLESGWNTGILGEGGVEYGE